MYQVSLFNGAVETIINYPTSDINAPRLPSIPFKQSLSMPDALSFSIYSNNPGYSLIEGLITKVKVTDLRDNSILFSGRVIPVKSNMSADGMFYKEVVCEGALAFLNDTQTRRSNLTNQTPSQILTYLLAQHNAKVDSSRQIQLGTVDVMQPITIDTNYETSLNAIVSKVRNVLGGDLMVRETSGILYLDYLQALGVNNGVEVRLGYNMKDLIRELDATDIVSRVIPMGYGEGINNLNIVSVNSGIEYIDNAVSVAKYGVIEGVATNKELQDAATLKIYGETVLSDKAQPRLTLSVGAYDLSVLAGHGSEAYGYGDTLHIDNSVMAIDVLARVIEREFDLIAPYDPLLVISTRPIRLSDQIVDLKQRSMTLEQSPQGNTVIFPIQAQENADSGSPITFDLDIPVETININRVYINLHGRKYRAYEKGMAAGGGSTATSSSGGGSTATSSSGGGSSTSSGPSSANSTDASSAATSQGETTHAHYIANDLSDPDRTGWPAQPHSHGMEHTHGIAHTHTVTIGGHQHSVVIPSHEHDLVINAHLHALEFAIIESTYPLNTRIKVNGIDIGLIFGDGSSQFDEYNIDITPHVSIGNNKIEISTEQNGRIEAIIYSQIFIQSK